MSIMTMIQGESGTGKTTALRNLPPEKTLLIRSIAKPLPFRSAQWQPYNRDNPTGSIYTTDNSETVCRLLKTAPDAKEIIILDDFQYIMANEFFRRSDEKGYDKFAEMGRNVFNILNTAQSLPENKRVYFLWHTETDPFGKVKAKTIGKMLDEKYTPEGVFTICLRTKVTQGVYQFSTQNDGADTVKSPIGMFSDGLIDNDLNEVDKTVCSYYGINQTTEKEAENV